MPFLAKPAAWPVRGVIARSIAAVLALTLGTASPAAAATYYWDTTTTGLWSDGANWSDASGIAGLTGVVPLATDSVVFNQAVVNGAETIQLDGATSIAGMTFLNTGTTTIQSSSTTPWTLTLGTGGIFIGSGAGAVTIGNATNAATLTASGAQVWTNASNNALTVVQQVDLASNNLTVNGRTTLTGGVTAGGSLTVGGGTLTLNAASAFSGTTTIRGGTLTIGTTGSLTGSSTLSLANGVLNYNPTSGTLSFATGGTTLGSGASSVTAAAGGTVNLGAITRSAGGVLNVGSTGSVVTSTANTNSIIGPWAFFGTGTSTRYAVANGASAITGLAVTGAAANTVTSTLGTVNANVNAAGTLGASANVNTLQYSGGAGTLTTSTAFTTRGILNTGTGTLTIAGAVTAASDMLVVNAANNGITFNSSLTTLSGTQQVVLTGGSAIATGTLGTPFITGIAGTPVIKNGTNTFTITTTGAVANISGAVPITVNGGVLSIAGSNNAVNGRLGTGAITLNAAGAPTVAMGTAGSASTSANALNITGAVGTAVVQSNSGAHTWSGAIAFQSGTTAGTTLRFVNTNGSASTMTVSGAVSGVGNLEFSGTGNGSPFALSNASINNTGTISLTSTNAAGDLTINGTIGPNVTGIRLAPTVAGADMTLSGTNTFNGPVTVTVGTLNFNTINSIGAASGSALGQPTSAVNGTIFLGGSGRLNYTGVTASSNRPIVMTGTGTIENNSGTVGSTLTLSGGIAGNNTAILLRGSRNIAVSGLISLGSGGITKTDAGTVTLTGGNLFSGNVTISTGTLSVNSIADSGPSALGTGTLLTLGQTNTTPSGTLIVTGSAANSTSRELRIIGSTSGTAATQTIQNDSSGPLTFGGTFSYTAGTGTMNLQLQGSGIGVFNSAINSATTGTPALALTKAGTGTWTLSQDNVYQGATAINQGALVINGSPTGTTGYAVSGTAGNNATLAGSGTLAAPVTLGVGTAFTGAAVNPGTVGAAGTLTVNAALSTAAFSRLNFDLNTATTAGGGVNDLISTTTLPVLGGVTQVNVNALTPLTTGGAYTLISGYTGTIDAPSNLVLGTLTGDPDHTLLGFLNNDGSLQVVAGGATPTTAYWANNQATGVWNSVDLATATTNWNTAATGGIDTNAIPGATTTVRFSTTTPTPSTTATTLGQDFSIAGLVFEASQGSTAIGIGGANTLTVGTGGITVGGGVPTITAGLALGGAQSWTNNAANPLTVAAVTNGANTVTVLGSGGFAQTGVWGNGSGGLTAGPAFTGTLTLGQANTFTGAVTVNSGTVVATGDAGALGAGTLALAGGTLRLTNASGSNLSFNRNTTVSGNAAITSDVTEAGVGNTYTLGTLAIGAQTLSIGGGANVNDGTAGVTFGAVTLTGAPTFTVTNPAGSGATLLTLGAITGTNVLTTFNGTGNATVGGVIGTGTGGVTKSGAGTLTLSAANTYTGTTTLSAGILRATTSASALGAGALSLGGGTLQLANNGNLTFGRDTTVTASSAITADRLAAAATATTHTLGTLSIGAQTLTINRGSNITGSANGIIAFGNATLTGAATFSPQASAGLTLGGTTALATHTLNKAGAGSMTMTGVVSGTKAAASNALNVTAGSLTLNAAGNTFSGDININGATAVVSMAGGTFTTANPLGTQASVYKSVKLSNGGTFRLASGSYNVNVPTATEQGRGQVFSIGTGGGTLEVASGATLTIDDGTGAAGTAWTAPQLQGSGTLTKTGNGVLTLGAASSNFGTSFTGAIVVNAGRLVLGGTGSPLGNTAAGTTVNSGAALNVNGTVQTVAEPLTIFGTGETAAPAGALTNLSANAATWAGPVTLGGAATIGSSAAGGLTLSSAATVNTAGHPLTFAISGGGRIFTDGVISGAGSVVFNGTSTGEYVPRADHTYGGGTTLSAGPVAVDRSSTGPAGAPTAGAFGTGTLTLAGSTLRSSTGTGRTVGNPVTLSADTTFVTLADEKTLTFSGPVTLGGGNRTLTANAGTTVAGIATVFSGAIGDGAAGLGLTKAGTGNLILGGGNTYTGGTTATAGILVVTGSLADNTGLSLLPATAGGAVVSFVNNAANTPANFSSLTIGSPTGTSFLGLDLGTASDSIVTSAAATAANSITFHLNASSGFGAGTYTLISAASGLTAGGATYGLGSVPGGYTYNLNSTDSQVQLTATGATAANLYWRGNLSNSWAAFSGTTTTNWATDAAGATVSASTPGAGDTVLFSATGATGPALATTLDNAFIINDLQFLSAPSGVTSVAVNPGLNPGTAAIGTLTLSPTSATAGLTLTEAAGAVTIAAPITLGAPQTWSVDSSTPAAGTASSLTVSGAISGLAANGITFTTTAGSAAIILGSAANTYAGPSQISPDTILQGGIANGFSPNTAWTVDGTLNTGAFNQNTGSLVGGAGIVQNGSGTNATLTIGSDNLAAATFAGTIQNGSTGTLGLTKAGTGIQVLSGTNSYTGATTVSAGTLRIGAASASPTGSALTVNATGTFDLFGNSITVAGITGGGAAGIITNASGSTAASTATTAGTPSGAGVYVDALTITAAGQTIVPLITDGATRKTQLVVNNAHTTNLVGLTNGVLNTFSGGLVLANNATGTRLNINAAVTGTPFGTGPIILGQTSTDRAGIYFNTADNTLSLPIVFNTALGTDRFGIRNDGRTITLAGLITANADAVFSANSATASTTIISNRVTGAGGLVIDLSQTSVANTLHTVRLATAANASDYAGDTVVGRTEAVPGQNYTATLALGASNQIPNGAGKGNVILNSNTASRTGTLNLAGFSDTINGLSGNGTVDGTSGTPTLTLGDGDATASFSGIIRNTAGTLTLAKIGSGTQTLSGASTFAGPVNVNGGLIAFATSPATSGPLGNSTVVNLSGGGISYTAAGTNALNRSIAIGAGNGTVDVASAAGTLTLPGASVTSTGGGLVKTGAGVAALGGTTTLNGGLAGVVVNGGVLQAGFGTGGIGSITVSGSGNLVFQNSVAETLTLGSSGTVLALSNGARLGFELDGSTSDGIVIPTGGGLSLAGGFTFDFFNTGLGVSPTTYTLLTAPAGSALNTFTYTLGAAPLGYNYSFLTSDTQVLLQTAAYTPIYWTGATDGSWATAANFATDAAGTTPAGSPPLATETVIFNATNAVGPTVATTLDGSTTVDSLQFNGAGTPGTTVATIAPGTGGTLTLKPASASGGIAILSGGGSATISAAVTLDDTLAAAQAWSVVDAASTLTLSGNVVFGANINKSGAGTVVLAGSNSGAGNFNLNAGGLHLNTAAALGTGGLSLAVGTTLDNTSGGAVILTGNGPTNINGDFTFTGSGGLNLGTGAVTLTGNPTVTVAASTLTLGGAVGGTSSLTKAGAGSLVLNGARSFTGALTVGGGALTLGGNSTGSGTVTLNAGTLNLGIGGALGSGAFLINGGTLDNTSGGALTNATNNAITIGGGFTFTGTDDLNLGTGAIGLSATPTITVAAKTLTLAGNITGGTFGLTKGGPGTLTLAGTNTYTGNTIVNGGTLNITGSITGNTTASRLDYGTTAGTTVVNHSGSLTAWVTRGADVAGAVSVFNQTAGTVTIVPTNSADNQWVARTGYGALNITGGTFNTGRFDGVANAGTNGVAVMYVGGAGTLNQNVGDWFLPIRTNGTMSLTVAPGGTFTRQATVTNQFSIIGLDGTNSYGVFNVAGGAVDTGPTRGISFSSGFSPGAGNVGFLNAAGGTLAMGANVGVGNAAGSTSAFINFGGATIRANAALTAVIPASTANYTFRSTIFGPVTNNNSANAAFNSQIGSSSNFAGGLVVDTNSFSVTFSNPLLGADGTFGVTQPDITIPSTGNSGYAGAPMVQFAAPSAGGTPASGYALISGGQVTGIVITNPGTYAAGETPQITLTGGGGSIAAFTTAALATANTSAGITKTGAGTLVLGDATSTFTGPVVVNAGSVQSNGTGSLANIGTASAFGLGNATSNATNAASVVLNGGLWSITNTGAPVTTDRLFTMTQNGGTLSVENTTAANVITFGNQAPIAYTGSGARTLTLQGAHAGGVNANTFAPRITDAGADAVTVTKAGTTNWQLTNALNGYTGGTNLQQGILGFVGGALGTSGSITFTGSSTLQWATGNSEDVSGRLVMTTGVAATLDTLGNAVTLASAIGSGSSGSLVKTGTGTLTLTGANTYTGTTTINQGTVKLTGSAVLGGAAGSTTDANNIVFGQNLDSGVLEFDTVASLGPADQIRFRNTGGTAGLGGALVYVGSTDETLSKGIQCDTSIGIRIESNSAGGSLTVNGPFTQTNRAIYLGGSGTGNNTLASVFTGTGGLTKRDPGRWVLSGANTYSGTTTIAQGTLAFTADQALTGGLVFGAANGATNNGRLDLSTANATFPSLLVRTNSATANTVTVGSGETFAINGNVTLGYDASGGTGATRSNLTVSGAGGMTIAGTTITIGTNQAAQNAAYWNDATLDVSGLSSFSTNVTTFNIGVGGTTQGPGTVLLSNAANTIVATTLTVGDTGANNGRGPGTLVFGTGTNVVQADTIQIGRGKDSGRGFVQFASQVTGSPGTVVIANKAGTGAANITVGSNGTTTGTAGGAVGTLDLRGHVATVAAGNLSVGINSQTSAAGGVTGTVSFDAGTFTASTVSLGIKTGANTGAAIGTLNVGGGSFTVNAGGSFTLGSQATAGTSTATLNLTGGTFTSNVDILDGGGVSTSAINLSGGILDMAGRNIGNATNVINTLTLASGTLTNVGQINNGAAITKTTAGTLALTGSNAYTGQTIVQAGTLSFDTIANVGAGSSALGAPATTGNGTIALGAAATGATLQYLGAAVASTDRIIDLAGTTGGATLDSSGTGAITFASSLTASGAGSKTLTLAGTNAGSNTLAGVIPDNGPGNATALVKTGLGRWVLSGANTYTGGTTVGGGTLALSGSGTLGGAPVMIDGGTLDLGGLATATVINYQSGGLANANLATLTNVLGGATLTTNGLTLGGTVNVTGVLGGSGTVGLIAGSGVVAPGNSPGILTASQLDFSGGIGQKFEFTAAGVDPTWSDALASVNDVLRLMNADPFNATVATGANVFDIYFNVSSLAGSEVFYGGIFTDSTVDPLPGLTDATFNYFVRGDGSGSIPYKGANYYTLAQYNAANSTAWAFTAGTKRVPVADFAGGTVTDGHVQVFAVPEPAGFGLLIAGALTVAGIRRFRRARPA